MHSFRCPYCSVSLRVRDLSYRGRTIPCPECHQPVAIEEVAGELVGRGDESQAPAAITSRDSQKSPRAMVLTATAIVMLVFGGLVWHFVTQPEPLQREAGQLDDSPPLPPAAHKPPVQELDPPVEVLLADDEALPEPLPVTVMPIPTAPPAVPPVNEADAQPIDVLLAEEGPGFDIRERLAQPIVSFRPSQPLPVEDLLFEVQELLGAPIDLAAIPEAVRRRTISVESGQTTVQQLLEQISQAADVGFEIDPRRIVMTPTRAAE